MVSSVLDREEGEADAARLEYMKGAGPSTLEARQKRGSQRKLDAAYLPRIGLQALIALRRAALTVVEPLDYTARVLNGKSHFPSMSLRRYAGPLASLEASGAEFLAYLKLLCHAKPDSVILDIGCGFGLIALSLENYLIPPGKYVGLDINRQAVRWAQRRISTRALHLQFLHLDIKNGAYNPGGQQSAENIVLPMQPQSFDIVLLKSVFTHLRPREVANYLHEIARLLRPDGVCLSTFFLLNEIQESNRLKGLNAVDFRFGDDHWRYSIREMPEVAVAYGEQSMQEMAAQEGLTVADTHYGTWSGRPGGLSYQDIVLLTRARP